MSIYLIGLLTGLLAVFNEAVMKQSASWLDYWWLFVANALAINYGVFWLVKLAPSLPSAFIVFAATTLTMRTAWSWWAGHPIGLLLWIAIGLHVAALILRHVEAS